jgi:methionyl-tRNA synthetase
VRYYLLREIPAYGDGDYSEGRFLEIYNSELANNLGNLVSRVAKLAEGLEFKSEKVEFSGGLIDLYNSYKFNEVVITILRTVVDEANETLNLKTPWKLEKENQERKDILFEIVKLVRIAAYCLSPIIPDTSKKIEEIFSGVIKPLEKPLFPRIK